MDAKELGSKVPLKAISKDKTGEPAERFLDRFEAEYRKALEQSRRKAGLKKPQAASHA